MCASRGMLAKLNYMDIKQILYWKVIENKWVTLTNGEIHLLVQEIHNHQRESELDLSTVEREMEAIQKKMERYNAAQLGDIPMEQEDGTMHILVCQMGVCPSVETMEIKIAATEWLIRKYDVSLCLFMELNYNWSKVNSSTNLASWFMDEEKETRCITAYSTEENDILFLFKKTSARGDKDALLTWISTVCLEAYGRSERFRPMVFLALLLQPNTCHENSSGIPSVCK
jgi:hypothetical protein